MSAKNIAHTKHILKPFLRFFCVFLALLSTTVPFSCKTREQASPILADYVNPLIGTAPATTKSALKNGYGSENYAQVVPFVTTPFGMTNWTPETQTTEQKCIAPYYYTDSIITGFRGSHWISGSCTQDYGSLTLMPLSGNLEVLPNKRGSVFDHDREKATAYSYDVHLDRYDIDVSMTATKRNGLFKIQYNDTSNAHLIITPNSDEGEGFIEILPEQNEIIGYNPVHRIYQGWGEPAGFSGFFVARFNAKVKNYGVFKNDSIFNGATTIKNNSQIGAYLTFDLGEHKTVDITVGTSFTSIEQARKNLVAETTGLDFETAREKLGKEWENLLGRVKLEGTNEEDKVEFYTAMYHAYLHPRTFNDVDGSYRSFAGGKEILNSGGQDYFVDFSMWDTYRASHPLFNLISPSSSSAMVNSLLLKAEQGGWLPIFPCWNSYTSGMIGDHAIATIADAYMKDIVGLNNTQYAYLTQNAFKLPEDFEDYKLGKGRRALDSYIKYGYVPIEDEVLESFHTREQVSRTLEYAFDDFTLSQVAKKMGDTLHFSKLRQRAMNYAHVFSKQDMSVRGKHEDGSFIAEFDKYSRQFFITEGTPFQYTWYVPHDVKGLANLMGGDGAFNKNLDEFYEGEHYWHGNEPGHQTPFLYNYTGQPWKTQKWVDDILSTEYSNEVGGLSGNDDAGQMSAWYVFASLGFYPVAPSVPEYVISAPHFDKITLTFENGKQMVINAPGASEGKKYIHGLRINGLESGNTFIDHFKLMEGGTMDFIMGEKPNMQWGTQPSNRPYSLSK